MSVCLVVISDGRPCHAQALASAAGMLPAFDQVVHVDDAAHELGFAGAIQRAWEQVDTEYVLHCEADFTFNRAVPVDAMADVLASYPHLVQMALLRQPWNEREKAAGGIVAMDPDLYTQRERRFQTGTHRWLEHRRNVTTNPSLWPRWVIDRGWPQREHSEGHFGIDLFASDPALRAAYWGQGEEWVTHIGVQRTGTGY